MKTRKNIFRILALCLVVTALVASFSLESFADTSKTNQHSTAYVWTGNKTASGLWPEVGYCAVHPTTSGGTVPRIPFGTVLYIDEIRNAHPPYETWDMIYHPTEGEMSTVQVQDIGDKYYSRQIMIGDTVTNLSTYFVDLYWGDDEEEAYIYGVRYIDYHY